MRAMACLIVSASVLLSSAPGRASQAPACASPANQVVAENCRPGHPQTEWDMNGSGDPKIQGFATDISVNRGETISFKVRTASPAYRIDIYRLGHYSGAGGRRVATIRPSVPLPQQQPPCLTELSVRLYDCGNWAVSASWAVPADAVSGLYLARLVREDDDPPTWRPDNGRVEQADATPPEPGPHAYGALGLGRSPMF